jgi:hypothetical protein
LRGQAGIGAAGVARHAGRPPPTCIGGCGFCAKMEAEWTPQMMEVLGVDATSPPIIQDADFFYAYGV